MIIVVIVGNDGGRVRWRSGLTDALTLTAGAGRAGLLQDRLTEYVRHAAGALSSQTMRALEADTRLFSSWCADQGRECLPATPETVAVFIEAMACSRRPASVKRYVSSVATLHRAARALDPTKDVFVKLAMRRLLRAHTIRQRQAAPIGEFQVAAMLAVLDDSVQSVRNRALLLVARDIMGRRSELVELRVEDLKPAEDGSATILLRRSKTDQAGEGAVKWLSPRANDAVQTWLAVSGVNSGYLFRSVKKGGRKFGNALSAGEVARIFKQMAVAARIDRAEDVSGHSCRVGMAQDLVASGAELASAMQAGRWKTAAMPARYSENLIAARGAVAEYYRKRKVT